MNYDAIAAAALVVLIACVAISFERAFRADTRAEAVCFTLSGLCLLVLSIVGVLS